MVLPNNNQTVNKKNQEYILLVKCQGDRLYVCGLKSVLRRADYILVSKEGMKEGTCDDELLKFLS